jgi:hypothetical protein
LRSQLRVHHEVPALGGADQATNRGLPFLEVLLGLRRFQDVIGGVFEREQLATAAKWNRIIEFARPVSHAAMTG